MAKYTQSNTVGSGINNLGDTSKKYSLSVDEMIAAKNRVLGSKGTYNKELEGVRNGDLNPVASDMFKGALEQLAYINEATKKEYNIEKGAIDKEISGLGSGESREWDISYKDVDGNSVQSKIGVEKDGNKNKFYFVDPDTGTKEYTSRKDFNERLNTSVRNRVKDEHGIGSELYTLSASDGTKFVITDAKDDSKAQKDFKNGFKDINMYVVKPDGERTQMTKQDVSAMVQENGITRSEVARGITDNLDVENIAKNVAKAVQKLKQDIESNIGLTTSTRA